MVDQRRDVICRLAVAAAARPGMAAERLTLTEASPVCVTARIERWSLPRAPDGGPVPPAYAAPEQGSRRSTELGRALENKSAELPDPGAGSPGMGLCAPERGRDQAAGLSRTGRAPRVLVIFAVGVCLRRPGRRCGGTRLARLPLAPSSPDESPRRRKPGLNPDSRDRDRRARRRPCAFEAVRCGRVAPGLRHALGPAPSGPGRRTS